MTVKTTLVKHVRVLCVLGLALGFMVGPARAVAAGSSAAAPGGVEQSYSAGAEVLSGMLVELKPQARNTVMPISSRDIGKLAGVVVPVNSADVVLTPASAATQQMLVAATGRYGVLVSNQNGAIKTGDYVTVSALDGIGMKAGSDQPEVIGQAADNFDGTGNVIDTVHLKNSAGHAMTVSIGRITVNVRLASNPLFKNVNNLPGFLNRAVKVIANKPVSPARVYLSLLVLIATLIIAGSMFYGGIRGGLVAIGRNPLAKKAVSRGLAQSVIFGLVVFAAGVLAVYVILI